MDSVEQFLQMEKLKRIRGKRKKELKNLKFMDRQYMIAKKLSESLIKKATPEELKLKRHLIEHGIKHTFQKPIVTNWGKYYIVDFMINCMQPFVIEVDGLYHQREDKMIRDLYRTDELYKMGYSVIRFQNSEIANNIEDVIKTIKARIS